MTQCRLLVVDDERNIRLMISQALTTSDTAVDTAVNGEEALQMMEQASYTLVLLDLRLPGMDGLAVLRAIRQQDATLPVIILTAHGTVETAVEAMRTGAVNFLQKPFAPKELRAAVASALQSSREDRISTDE